MDYFCVDIESSGPFPGRHSLLSLGICLVRRFEGRYQALDRYYVEFKPAFAEALPAAMAVNGLDLERLEAEGLALKEGLQQVAGFVQGLRKAKAKDRPVFVAHNAVFDWLFWTYNLGHAGLENPFGHSALDTKALAMGVLGISWNQTSLKSVAKKLSVAAQAENEIHHAGADANYLGEVFSTLMNYQREQKK